MRSLGKVHSLRVSGRYILVFGLFLLFFIVVSIIVINRYVDLYIENEALLEENVKLSRLVSDHRLKAQLANQYQLLIEELNQFDPPSEPASAKKVLAQQQAPATATPSKKASQKIPVVKQTVKRPPASSKKPLVDVSELILRTDEASQNLRFSFNLRKISDEIDLVSGYMIVILENHKVSPAALATFPASIKVVNGVPTNFRRGQQFAIRHGKIVKGIIHKVSDAKAFTKATIFAYSFKGELLLKKSIAVADAKKSS
ncbi:MAG: hypothetical protein JRG97_06710 [Deltaproteobacteria bacterium]|nr:hypothetical protein [Deltaproteobacteria bacterium]MBW2051613.1 hypothetical protein [Deltaproteobacteria bacterium]MBW2140747.1 hypothetical protein [Deltaproteobacteria bacterium]MBW2322698.1 hypothetical protein [Deltaproteobacteria bacterium]